MKVDQQKLSLWTTEKKIIEKMETKGKWENTKDLIFFFFFFLRSGPAAYGSSQHRGRTGAIAAGHRHSHSNTRSEPSLCPTPQLMAMPDP